MTPRFRRLWSREPDRFVCLVREKKAVWFARLPGVAVERHGDASYFRVRKSVKQAVCQFTQLGKLFARLRNRTVEIHRLRIRIPENFLHFLKKGYATGGRVV